MSGEREAWDALERPKPAAAHWRIQSRCAEFTPECDHAGTLENMRSVVIPGLSGLWAAYQQLTC